MCYKIRVHKQIMRNLLYPSGKASLFLIPILAWTIQPLYNFHSRYRVFSYSSLKYARVPLKNYILSQWEEFVIATWIFKQIDFVVTESLDRTSDFSSVYMIKLAHHLVRVVSASTLDVSKSSILTNGFVNNSRVFSPGFWARDHWSVERLFISLFDCTLQVLDSWLMWMTLFQVPHKVTRK
jgi:hypothetical protein